MATFNSQYHATDKSQNPKPRAAKPTEKNLIDFDFFADEIGDKAGKEKENSVGTKVVGDGWDAEVWADVDDDNWEPLEASKSD